MTLHFLANKWFDHVIVEFQYVIDRCHGAGVRCVQQRCVVPLPMPVPLPFPHLFGPVVSRYGDYSGVSAAQPGSTQPVRNAPRV